jgi:hypothetical protein
MRPSGSPRSATIAPPAPCPTSTAKKTPASPQTCACAGALTQQSTAYPTVGASKRSQLAYNAQLGYEIHAPGFRLMPAYRYAYFHPWQSGGTNDEFKAFRLTYHTLGLRFTHDKLPVSAWLNYTITQEPSPRTLDNNRVQLLGQVAF